MPDPRVVPHVSIVIPCRNESRHIENCLRSVLGQTEPSGGFEVLVVDGMSDDGTREILAKLASGDDRLHVYDNELRITPVGMNIGIKAARGKWVAMMGGHSIYAQDYLAKCLEVSNCTGADNVGGVMIAQGLTLIQQAIAAAHHSALTVGGARWHSTSYEGPADTVFGGFYRREVFDQIGLFDEELIRNQDDELNLRLSRTGGKIWHSPNIRSWYCPRSSLSGLFNQYFQYGYWKVKVIQKHRLPASWRHLVPAAFLMTFFGVGALAMFSRTAFFLWLVVVGAYLLLNLAASVDSAMRGGLKLLPVLPAVVGCFHFGYGFGFLLGIWDFVIRRKGHRASLAALTRESKRTRSDVSAK